MSNPALIKRDITFAVTLISGCTSNMSPQQIAQQMKAKQDSIKTIQQRWSSRLLFAAKTKWQDRLWGVV